jgi:hypothetical protein
MGLLAAALLLSGCGADQNAPARAVEDYLQALADKDADRLALLSCAEWQEDAQLTLDPSRRSRSPCRMSCETSSLEGDSAVVSCTGALAASYQKIRELDLSEQTFRMVKRIGRLAGMRR